MRGFWGGNGRLHGRRVFPLGTKPVRVLGFRASTFTSWTKSIYVRVPWHGCGNGQILRAWQLSDRVAKTSQALSKATEAIARYACQHDQLC